MKEMINKSIKQETNSRTFVNGILMYLMIFSSVLLCFIMVAEILGCISFQSNGMQDIFYASFMFLYSIIIYEYRYIKNSIKFLLIGVLCGNILFAHEEFFSILLIFFVNIIWDKIINGESYRSALRDIINVFFYSMGVVEVYSIIALANEYFYETSMKTSFLFNFVDVFFVVSAILFFCYGKEKSEGFVFGNELVLSKKKSYLRIVKLFIWCFLVIIIILIMFDELYMNRESLGESFQFYFGKSIDGGYLLKEESGTDLLYYAKRREPALGGVIENISSYDLIVLDNGLLYQIVLMYVAMYIYQFLYSAYSVVIMSTVVIGVLWYKISKSKKKFKRNVELRGKYEKV